MKNRQSVCPDERTRTTNNPVKKIRYHLTKPLTSNKIKSERNFIGQIDQVLQKINCKKKKGVGGTCSLKDILKTSNFFKEKN